MNKTMLVYILKEYLLLFLWAEHSTEQKHLTCICQSGSFGAPDGSHSIVTNHSASEGGKGREEGVLGALRAVANTFQCDTENKLQKLNSINKLTHKLGRILEWGCLATASKGEVAWRLQGLFQG